MSKSKSYETSGLALESVLADEDLSVKCALILLAIWFDPDSTNDEIAKATDLSITYVRPRLTRLKDDHKLIDQTVKSTQTFSKKAAWGQRLVPEMEQLFVDHVREFGDDAETLFDFARAVFIEADMIVKERKAREREAIKAKNC